MTPYQNRSSLLFILLIVLLALGASTAAGQDRTANAARSQYNPQNTHYIVFERDAAGQITPVYHTFVQMDTSARALSDTQYNNRMAAGVSSPQRAGTIGLTLVDSTGRPVYRATTSAESWVRGEFHGSDGIDGHFFPAEKSSFVARVPVIDGTQLQVSDASSGRSAAFSPDALSQDSAIHQPTPSQRVPAAPNTNNRVDLLMMGDGYTAAEETKFNTDVTAFVNDFFNVTPYLEYRDYVNVSSFFTPSNTSGASQPPYNASATESNIHPTECPDPDAQNQSSGVLKAIGDTAFDASFCGYKTWRLLVVNTSKVYTAAAAAPGWEHIMLIVNDAVYGGSGGSIAVSSMHAAAIDIAQHEYGHSFTDLADEYNIPYDGRQCYDMDTDPGNDCPINVTDNNGADRNSVKWSYWYNPVDIPIPTTNASAYFYNAALGEDQYIGLFEGAYYQPTGYFRSGDQCMMNYLNRPFCKVASEAYAFKLYLGYSGYDGIDIIDPGTESPIPGSTLTLASPDTLTFSADVLGASGGNWTTVEWWIDNTMVQTSTVPANSTVQYTMDATTTGTVTVTLNVFDSSPIVHPNNQSLTASTRQWTVDVQGGTSVLPSDRAVIGDLTTAVVKPSFEWDHFALGALGGDWYEIVVYEGDTEVFSQWYPATDAIGAPYPDYAGKGICEEVNFTCSAPTPDFSDVGFLSGDYRWWVHVWSPQVDEWTGEAPFTVDVPPAVLPVIAVNPGDGRIAVQWPDDPNTLWVNIWAGSHPAGNYFEWLSRDSLGLGSETQEEFTCDGTTCTAYPVWDVPTATNLTVWMQAWGPGGFSEGGTAEPAAPAWNQMSATVDGAGALTAATSFNLPADAPTVPTGIGVADATAADPTLIWMGQPNSTWYQVIMWDPVGGGVPLNDWYQAQDASCMGALVDPPDYDCELAGLGLTLTSGTSYEIYIQAWGPGGFSTGGTPYDPYGVGTFTYTPA